jgi:hypothetical protein
LRRPAAFCPSPRSLAQSDARCLRVRAPRSISLLTPLLGRLYYQDFTPGAKPGKLPIDANVAVRRATMRFFCSCERVRVEG